MSACRILLCAWTCLLGLVSVDAAQRIDAESTLKILELDGTVAIDLVATEPGTAMHPQALRWSGIQGDMLAGVLPSSLRRVVLLGAAGPDSVYEVERELATTSNQHLPVYHYAGPAADLAVEPATAIAGEKAQAESDRSG